MPSTRTRRIVRRAVIALAVVVLLPSSYVYSVVLLNGTTNAGLWTPSSAASADAVYRYKRPMYWYAYECNHLPGSGACLELIVWSEDRFGRNLDN